MSINTSHFVPFPREEVWDWHTRKGAVQRLTPPFTPMTPLQEADNIASGTAVFALPAGLRWEARHDITGYKKGHKFTDVCVSAPFKALTDWKHEHIFSDAPGGTIIHDRVSTRVPEAALTSTFAYRQHQLIEDLAAQARMREIAAAHGGPAGPLTIAVTGSHGTVGTAITSLLSTAGHTVIPLVRSAPTGVERLWHPMYPAPDLLEGVDAVIHLAGEPLLGRFNEEHKSKIRDSRVTPTRRLAAVAAKTPGLQAFVCASAIGYFGADRGDEILTEHSDPGEGFLADVCVEWEAACEPARDAGIRMVNVRTGIAQSAAGGVLPLLKTLFSAGLGGRLGDGTAWYSWVALDDLADVYHRAVRDPKLSGPVNAVSPTPVRNATMTKTLGAELSRPTIIPIPELGPALLLGKQGAAEMALANQRVIPSALNNAGHVFRYSTIAEAFAHELGGEDLLTSPAKEAAADE